MSRYQSLFNYRLNRCRCTVERSFGHLENRFQSIDRKMEYDLEHVKQIIKPVFSIQAQNNSETDWNSIAPTYKTPTWNVQALVAADVRHAFCNFFVQNSLQFSLF